VRQYNPQGKLVQLFASVTPAAQSVNVSPGNIVAALKDYQKAAGGYHWKYAKALKHYLAASNDPNQDE
jgi:hypothetical protein